LDPWRVISHELFNLPHYDIPQIINKTGLKVNWALTQNEDVSANTRKKAYRPRIDNAYDQLPKDDKLKVAYVAASELANRDRAEVLASNLEKIDWTLKEGKLIPQKVEVSELFFPVGTHHDAYVEIKKLFQKATTSLDIIDPYVDNSFFTVLGTISGKPLIIKLLTHNIMSSDFSHEKSRFLLQHKQLTLEVRKSKEFHDRFIILDKNECWHLGASIKDAGIRAFMVNQIQDSENQKALITQLKTTWESAGVFD
jgi:hypothetical protein